MMCLYSLAFLLVVLLQDGLAHPCHGPPANNSKPLFLTPLIRNGELEKAKQLSWVEPFARYDYTSFSGFITVDDKYDSNMFFWYFLAKNNSKNAPVLLWMTGGPGISSLSALFGETGPFYPDPSLNLRSREFNWVSEFNVIYVDVPAGGGFSFTNSTSGFASNISQMASQVASFLDQFFTLFAEYKDNDFYIVGKSYSGKLAVTLVAELLDRNRPPPANLVGLVTVCGFLDGVNMSLKSDDFHALGLINENQRIQVADLETAMVDSYLNGSLSEAYKAFSAMNKYLQKVTGLEEKSNLIFTVLPRVFSDYERFVDQRYVREMIHVGDRPLSGPDMVTNALQDLLGSSKPHVEYILSNSELKFLILSTQLDLYVAPRAQRQLVTTLSWPGAAAYNAAPRIVHKVDPKDEEVACYVQQAGQLTEVMIRSAGHMVCYDQPRATLDVLKRFIRNETFGQNTV